jgi:uncharacterized protein (TIGR03435 family)
MISLNRFLIAALFPCWSMAVAQVPSPEFEVASVRLNRSRAAGEAPYGVITGGPGTADPTRIRYHDIPFVQLVELAYGINTYSGLQNDEIFTLAPWMWDNLYEIIANVEPGATSAQMQSMLQKLLADRFGLRVHHETQKLFGSEVVIAKDGAKLQANQNPSLTRLPMVRDHAPNTGRFPEVPEGHAGIAMHYQQDGRVYLTAVAQSVSDLLGLSVFRYYHVVDRTGLGEQKYDFRLVFGVGLDLYGQMEKQLGLKVRSAEVSIDVLIIDKAEEMPTAN